MNLITKQKELREEGSKILEKLGLIKILSTVGTPSIVGSFALDLMVWRDIDIEVVVEKYDKEIINKVCSSFVNKDLRRIDFAFIDHRDKKDSSLPKGFYLGIKFLDTEELISFKNNENVWKMDVWFVEKGFTQGFEKTNEIKPKLNEENRKIILKIKDEIKNNPKYRKGIFAVDIYKGVLENGVKNLEDFKDYLKSIGKSLED